MLNLLRRRDVRGHHTTESGLPLVLSGLIEAVAPADVRDQSACIVPFEDSWVSPVNWKHSEEGS